MSKSAPEALVATYWKVRRAVATDQAEITQLVHRERLNPNRLHWPHFVVASVGDCVVGAVQMRRHADGSRELASLVVDAQCRGQGLGARLITRLLHEHSDVPVHVITAATRAAYFERWGFRVIAAGEAPRAVRRHWRIGQFFGGLVSLLRLRSPRRLVILERA